MAEYPITPINIREASLEVYRALFDFVTVANAEYEPDEPAKPFEELLAGWQNLPASYQHHQWLIWDGQKIIARLRSGYEEAPKNRHMLDFHLYVLPNYRRQGLARRLLPRLLELSHQTGRPTLVSYAGRVPGGTAFLRRLGAEAALEMQENQLVLSELDSSLLRRWLEAAPRREFELGFWDGALPESELEALCRLWDVMNNAPLDNLKLEDQHMTPKKQRQIEQRWEAIGHCCWTAYVRQSSDGRLVGFSRVGWSSKRPQRVGQYDTGVLPEFRGRGLGRWLKAAMLERILNELPEARWILTNNANSNAPMLKINHQLGFKLYQSNAAWQLEATQLEHYLKAPTLP